MVLEQIKKNFSGLPVEPEEKKAEARISLPEKNCEACGAGQWWLPKAPGSVWLCADCNPPAVKSLAAKFHTVGQVAVISSQLVTCCRQWCAACGCWQAVAQQMSDGSTRHLCRSCKADLPEWPPDNLVEPRPSQVRPDQLIGPDGNLKSGSFSDYNQKIARARDARRYARKKGK